MLTIYRTSGEKLFLDFLSNGLDYANPILYPVVRCRGKCRGLLSFASGIENGI